MAAEPVYDPKYIAGSEYRTGGRAVRPRDAATLIIVRSDGDQPRILMGQRAAGHTFMPNKFVFPGGKVDAGDHRLQPPFDLHPAVMARLARGCSETRARALAMAAIRETFEETGLVLGEPDTPTLRTRSPHWRDFLQYDVNPRLDSLHLVARLEDEDLARRTARQMEFEWRSVLDLALQRQMALQKQLALHWQLP